MIQLASPNIKRNWGGLRLTITAWVANFPGQKTRPIRGPREEDGCIVQPHNELHELHNELRRRLHLILCNTSFTPFKPHSSNCSCSPMHSSNVVSLVLPPLTYSIWPS